MANLGRPPPRTGNKNPPPTEEPAALVTHGRPTTRSSTVPISAIIDDASEGVTDATSARKFLDTTQFCIPGEDMTPEHLSHALFYISQKAATPTVRSMIRAAAFLATTLTVSPIATSIQQFLSSGLVNSADATTPHQNDELKEITAKLDGAIDQWSSQQESMKRTLDKVPQLGNPTDLILMDARIQTISENVATIQVMMKEMKTQANARPASPSSNPHSYCDAAAAASTQQPKMPAARNFSPGSDQARGCSAIKQRQLLLDPDSDHPLIKSDTTTDCLAATFQQALNSLDTIAAPSLQFRSLFRLCNQGIVLELSSAEVAHWVKSPANRAKFTEKLGGKICLKDRQYNVVVPFLPVSTDISAPDTIQHIEEGNELPSGSHQPDTMDQRPSQEEQLSTRRPRLVLANHPRSSQQDHRPRSMCQLGTTTFTQRQKGTYPLP